MASCPNGALVVFDWDDTLFPTTFAMNEPRLRTIFCKDPVVRPGLRVESLGLQQRGALRALQAAGAAAIKAASLMGRVVIVTLAEEAWVQQSSRKLMPALARAIQEHNVAVVSAQNFRTAPTELSNGVAEGEQPRELAELVGWKAAAMRSCLTSGDDAALDVYSIGDSEIEAHAAREVALSQNAAKPPCMYKVLKLCEQPSLEVLVEQLQNVPRLLSIVASNPQSIFADIRNLKLPPYPRRCKTPQEVSISGEAVCRPAGSGSAQASNGRRESAPVRGGGRGPGGRESPHATPHATLAVQRKRSQVRDTLNSPYIAAVDPNSHYGLTQQGPPAVRRLPSIGRRQNATPTL